MTLLKNSDGQPSLTHTISVVAFFVVMLKVLLGGASLSIGSSSFSFGTIDSFSIAAILTPTLGSYVARRYMTGGTGTDMGSAPHDGAA